MVPPKMSMMLKHYLHISKYMQFYISLHLKTSLEPLLCQLLLYFTSLGAQYLPFNMPSSYVHCAPAPMSTVPQHLFMVPWLWGTIDNSNGLFCDTYNKNTHVLLASVWESSQGTFWYIICKYISDRFEENTK